MLYELVPKGKTKCCYQLRIYGGGEGHCDFDSDIRAMSFQEAAKDTPKYRAAINSYSEEVDVFARWIEGLAQTIRAYLDDCISNGHITPESNDSFGRTLKRTTVLGESCVLLGI
jgi:hypothetical protein